MAPCSSRHRQPCRSVTHTSPVCLFQTNSASALSTSSDVVSTANMADSDITGQLHPVCAATDRPRTSCVVWPWCRYREEPLAVEDSVQNTELKQYKHKEYNFSYYSYNDDKNIICAAFYSPERSFSPNIYVSICTGLHYKVTVHSITNEVLCYYNKYTKLKYSFFITPYEAAQK